MNYLCNFDPILACTLYMLSVQTFLFPSGLEKCFTVYDEVLSQTLEGV
jgi:hypothetical protein